MPFATEFLRSYHSERLSDHLVDGCAVGVGGAECG